MIDATLPFAIKLVDIPAEKIDEIVEHLNQEIQRDYMSRKANRGRRLFPQAVRSIELVGEEGTAVITEGEEMVHITFSLPVFDLAGGYSSIRCSCQQDAIQLELIRCHHMWLTQYALQQALLQQKNQLNPSAPTDHLFASLDSLVSESHHQMPPGQQRCCFLFKYDGSISPLVQKWTQEGGWSAGRSISWREFLNSKELWLTQPYSGLAGLVDTQGQLSDLLAALRVLAPLNCLQSDKIDNKTVKVEIKEQPVILRGQLEEEGITIIPQFSDKINIKIVTAEGFVGWAEAGQVIYFFQPDKKLYEFYHHLLKQPTTIPSSDQDRLIQYLSQLSNKVVLSLDTITTEVTAEEKIYLRLTPLDSGAVKGELWVKPSPTGSYFAPGEGVETVLDFSQPQQAKKVIRDLWRERDLASQVIDELDLGRFIKAPGMIWLPREQEVLEILQELEQPRIKKLVIVEWPEYLGDQWRRQHEVTGELQSQPISLSIGGEKDWFAVAGEVEYSGQSLSLQELLAALRQGRKYIQLKSGQWTRITEAFSARLEKLSSVLDTDDDGLYAHPSACEFLDEGKHEDNIIISQASKEWWALKRKISHTVAMDDTIPDGINATLRPYQIEGVRWLNRLVTWELGACLADDMGLGKTLQTISVLLKQATKGPSLVIAPLSVVSNWQSEIKRFCPQLQPISFREHRQMNLEKLKAHDILIVGYGLIWRELDALLKVSWNMIVLDEAQNIKNARSKTAKAAQQLQARSKVALSGTPIENHLGDLWSLFRTINPSLLGTWDRFKRVYGFPISRDDNDSAKTRLTSRIAPFILRRLKNDHLKELPPKTEINLQVDMSESEMDVYQTIRLQAMDKLTENDSSEGDQNQRLQILSALTRMRQAASHPALILDQWQQSSSKLEVFSNLAEQVVANGHKALVFSQFTKHLALVRHRLEDYGYSYAYLDGSTSGVMRQMQIDQFQKGNKSFFLISLKAGGTGITLTEADIVIHMDPWWNPAIEDQATDRAYRMGQKKPVTVYRLICKNTVEELIVSLHDQKRNLASSILSNANTMASLDLQHLRQMIINPGSGYDLQ